MIQFDTATQRLGLVNLEQIFVTRDLSQWRDELSIVGVELAFCYDFLSSILASSKVKTPGKYRNILDKLTQMKETNVLFDDRLQQLSLQFDGYAECDDMQCDQYYISNHLDFREKIEKHLFLYRRLKKKLICGMQLI